MKPLILICALALSGCQTLLGIAAAIPAPTPQENCEASHGHWRSITRYDADGNATDGGGECVQ